MIQVIGKGVKVVAIKRDDPWPNQRANDLIHGTGGTAKVYFYRIST